MRRDLSILASLMLVGVAPTGAGFAQTPAAEVAQLAEDAEPLARAVAEGIPCNPEGALAGLAARIEKRPEPSSRLHDTLLKIAEDPVVCGPVLLAASQVAAQMSSGELAGSVSASAVAESDDLPSTALQFRIVPPPRQMTGRSRSDL